MMITTCSGNVVGMLTGFATFTLVFYFNNAYGRFNALYAAVCGINGPRRPGALAPPLCCEPILTRPSAWWPLSNGPYSGGMQQRMVCTVLGLRRPGPPGPTQATAIRVAIRVTANALPCSVSRAQTAASVTPAVAYTTARKRAMGFAVRPAQI